MKQNLHEMVPPITGLKLQDILVYIFFLQNKLTHAIQPAF